MSITTTSNQSLSFLLSLKQRPPNLPRTTSSLDQVSGLRLTLDHLNDPQPGHPEDELPTPVVYAHSFPSRVPSCRSSLFCMDLDDSFYEMSGSCKFGDLRMDGVRFPQVPSQVFQDLGLFKEAVSPLALVTSKSTPHQIAKVENKPEATSQKWLEPTCIDVGSEPTRCQSVPSPVPGKCQIPLSRGLDSFIFPSPTSPFPPTLPRPTQPVAYPHDNRRTSTPYFTNNQKSALPTSSARKHSHMNTELESTLLSYTSDDDLLLTREYSALTTTGVDDHGISACPSTALGPSEGFPQQFLSAAPSSLIFQSTAELFRAATGIVSGQRYSPQTTQVSFVPQSPRQLAARLALFTLRWKEFFAKATKQTPTFGTTSEAMIWCLRSFGFKIREAWLCPIVATSHLETHRFWIIDPPHTLIPNDSGTDHSDWRLIVDFTFSELFRVARPSDGFAHIFSAMRHEFIGSAQKDLPEAIEWISRQARRSLEERSLSVAPWRQCSFLQSCYARGIERAEKDPTFRANELDGLVLDVTLEFLHGTRVFWSSLGFEVNPDGPQDRSTSHEARGWSSASVYSFSFEKKKQSPRKDDNTQPPPTSALSEMLSSTLTASGGASAPLKFSTTRHLLSSGHRESLPLGFSIL